MAPLMRLKAQLSLKIMFTRLLSHINLQQMGEMLQIYGFVSASCCEFGSCYTFLDHPNGCKSVAV